MTLPSSSRSSLALEHRPKRWTDVVGQELPVRVLRNMLAIDAIEPAYLFHGRTGSGKTSCARLFAKALACEARDPETQDPCGSCKSCKMVDANTHPDVRFVDGSADRSISFVREGIKPFLSLKPQRSRKVMAIDEVQSYEGLSQTALLTTLENMPERSLLVFCTTDLHKIQRPLVNRCFPLAFSSLGFKAMASAVHQRTNLDLQVLEAAARECGGSMRSLWSLVDVWQHTGEPFTTDLVLRLLGGVNATERKAFWQALARKDNPTVIRTWGRWMAEQGTTPAVMRELLLRDLVAFAAKHPDDRVWYRPIALLGDTRITTDVQLLASLLLLSGLSLVE